MLQHLGNLSPEDREEDPAIGAVAPPMGTPAAIVRDSPSAPTARWAGAAWSYKRDIGTRIV